MNKCCEKWMGKDCWLVGTTTQRITRYCPECGTCLVEAAKNKEHDERFDAPLGETRHEAKLRKRVDRLEELVEHHRDLIELLLPGWPT